MAKHTFPTLATLTDDDRAMNSWAIRSFRDVADADYISARMACRAQLPVQYLWGSQQALEKYLKFILFLSRIPARGVGHDLRKALTLIEEAGLDLDLNAGSRKFIDHVADLGEYRYMEASFYVDWHSLTLLDRAVWALRRFCTLASDLPKKKLVEGRTPPRAQLPGGYLEKVIKNKANPAREPLLWQNAYFGRARRTIRLRGGFISSNSPLLYVEDVVDRIRDLALIPKDVLTAYREHVWKPKQP